MRPSPTLNTSVESAPANAGLWALNRSSACWDSVPGMLKSSAASPPAPAAAPSRTMTRIAPRRLRFQWWVSVRARRASNDDINELQTGSGGRGGREA
jgi:hypothetical protein